MIDYNEINKFFKKAFKISQKSPDSETKVGYILYDFFNNRIVNKNYNRFVSDKNLPTTRPKKYEYIIHAEVSLINDCAKKGIKTKGMVLFGTLSPCVKCLRNIKQAGIKCIYFKDFHYSVNYKNIEDLNITIYKEKDYYRIYLK